MRRFRWEWEPVFPALRTTKTDPVCGTPVNVARAAASAEYRGSSYYFCSLACGARFCGSLGS